MGEERIKQIYKEMQYELIDKFEYVFCEGDIGKIIFMDLFDGYYRYIFFF